MDAPRSVALAYLSAQARPLGLVQMNVVDPDSPAQFSLRLLRPDNSHVTFTNGSTELFFQGGTAQRRIGAQFDASSLQTGAYSYTAVVASISSTGTRTERFVAVRVVIVNERASPMGAGWSVPGVKRLHPQADGSVVLTGGDGTAAFFFLPCGTCAYVSPTGDFTRLTRGSGSYERVHPDSTRERYDGSGRLLSVTDRLGNATVFTYDAYGRIWTIQDPAGLAYTFTYNAVGKLASIRDPGGRTSTMTVDAAGDLVLIRDPAGGDALRATYNALHQLLTRTDRAGSVWSYAYDRGALASQQLPTVSVLRNGAPASVRPTVRYRSLESRIVPAPGTGTAASPAPVAASPVYVNVTDPRGFKTSRVLNRFGAATRINEPYGRVTSLEYNTSGQVTRILMPAGQETRYYWTGARMDSSYNSVDARRMRYTYGAFGQLTEVYDGTRRTVYTLDAQGRVQSYGPPGGPVTSFTYDARGRVTSTTDAGGHVSRYHFRSTGLMNTDSVVSESPRRRLATTYDGLGRPHTVTQPTGAVEKRFYDALNRATMTILPGGDTIRYGYGAIHLASVTDPSGAVRQFGHNALGWLTSETDAVNRTAYAYYDESGNLVRRVNRGGQTVDLVHDAYGRVTQRTAGGQTATYAFDPLGRWSAGANAEAADTTWYDPSGRPDYAVTQMAGVRYEKDYTYGRGRRVSLAVRSRRYVDEQVCWYDVPVGAPDTQLNCLNYWTVSYNRGTAGELTGISHAGHYVTGEDLQDPDSYVGTIYSYQTTVGRDAERNAALIQLTPAESVTRAFGGFHRPETVTYSRDSVSFALGGIYSRNLQGRVTQRIYGAGDSVASWGYDPRGRLAIVGRMQDQREVLWDRMGNPADSGAVVLAGHRLQQFRSGWMQYDADGNAYSRSGPAAGQEYLQFNALGQLVEASGQDANQDDKLVTFGYDAYGRRVRKTVNGQTKYYLNDGDDLIAEISSWGGLERTYAHNPGIDDPHSVVQGDSVYFYLMEAPGNVVGLMNRQGALVNRYEYTPFGELTFARERVPNDLRFGARPYDAETGLYYHRARYYDPHVRRFISEDPVGLAGGLNPYVFAANDPITYRDPSGRAPDCWVAPAQPSHNGADEELGQRLDMFCLFDPLLVTAGQGYRIMNAMEAWIHERTQELDAIMEKAGVYDFAAGVADAQQRAVEKGCGNNFRDATVAVAFDAFGLRAGSALAHNAVARGVNASAAGHLAASMDEAEPLMATLQQQVDHALLVSNDTNIRKIAPSAAGAAGSKGWQARGAEWGTIANAGGAGAYEAAKLTPILGTGLEIGEALMACVF